MLTGRLRFGPFEVDLASGELWRDGRAVPIQDLPFRLLAALVERPGEVVPRAELAACLWGTDTFVDAAAGLNTAVAKLREALGDDAETPSYVETVPKRGYRFIAPVDGSTNDRSAKASAAPSSATPLAEPWSARALAERPTRSLSLLAGAAAIVVAIAAAAVFHLRADRGRARVAVVLFDNETGDAALAPFAQGLTDATVTALAADTRLAVIGNAAILRTERPFRDIQAIRDALSADYIVIGQVQTRDDQRIVRAHLIRARDQAHVWVDVAPMAAATETAFQDDVSGRIRDAVARAVGR